MLDASWPRARRARRRVRRVRGFRPPRGRGRAHRARARPARAGRPSWAASCAPAAPATTRSRPLSGCTCATPPAGVARAAESSMPWSRRPRHHGTRHARHDPPAARAAGLLAHHLLRPRTPSATSTGCATGTDARPRLAARRRRARRLVARPRPGRAGAGLRRRRRQLDRRGGDATSSAEAGFVLR